MTISEARPSLVPAARPLVYGADWCEDTQRALRLMRRLAVAHDYVNVDEDVAALERAKALNNGAHRTPVIAIAGVVLVEPSNSALSDALVSAQLLSGEDAIERLTVQNVGDVERTARLAGGLVLIAAAQATPRLLRWPMRMLGAALVATGVTGWCPGYRAAGVTSLEGPGDRPHESTRTEWLTRVSRVEA